MVSWTMDKDAALRAWSDILTRGEKSRPTEAVLLELSEYSGKSVAEVRQIQETVHEISKERWEEVDRSSPAAVRDFYKNSWNIVFSGLNYHARQAEGLNRPLPVDVVAAIPPFGSAEMLEFGAGVGTAGVLFARAGWRVTLADISVPLLEFAKWRLARLGVGATFIDLNEEALGPNKYDLITAFNTMAQIPPSALDETLVSLRNALRTGGLLVFDVDARRRSRGEQYYFYAHPHYYAHTYEVVRRMRRLGFVKKPNIGPMLVFQRADQSPLSRTVLGLVDLVRYSTPAAWAHAAVDRVRSRVLHR
jgi:SAM-dependent methyltransferase